MWTDTPADRLKRAEVRLPSIKVQLFAQTFELLFFDTSSNQYQVSTYLEGYMILKKLNMRDISQILVIVDGSLLSPLANGFKVVSHPTLPIRHF